MSRPVIDLDYYAWRESATDESGEERLLTPWGDPMKHENDFGFVFASAQEAIDFKMDDEEARNEDWVLVHYRGEIVQHNDGADGHD